MSCVNAPHCCKIAVCMYVCWRYWCICGNKPFLIEFLNLFPLTLCYWKKIDHHAGCHADSTFDCTFHTSWSPMPCGKHGPRDSADKNRGRRPRFLSLLRPESLQLQLIFLSSCTQRQQLFFPLQKTHNWLKKILPRLLFKESEDSRAYSSYDMNLPSW